MQWRVVIFLLIACLTEVSAQLSRTRAVPERKVGFVVQAGVGLPELYGVGAGFVTDEKWIISVIANGHLLRDMGLRTASGIGVQVTRPIESGRVFDVLTLPNSLLIQSSYLFATPKVDGDGIAVSIYGGYHNPDRPGMNVHTYIGLSACAARGYRPLFLPALKLGLNYNIASSN